MATRVKIRDADSRMVKNKAVYVGAGRQVAIRCLHLLRGPAPQRSRAGSARLLAQPFLVIRSGRAERHSALAARVA